MENQKDDREVDRFIEGFYPLLRIVEEQEKCVRAMFESVQADMTGSGDENVFKP